jgi:hypothetical protein
MTEPIEVPTEFSQALRALGLAAGERLAGEPLAGGVSSDIWRIDTAHGPVCAKRALPKLRVAADWRAPIERNRYEARWLAVANEAQPGCAPRVLGQHEALGVLAMEWLDPRAHRNWKDELRDGRVDAHVASGVGRTLARIHACAAARPALAREFDSDAIFFDIRLEPYLLANSRACIRTSPPPSKCWSRPRGARSARWCTATRAPRTSWSDRTDRCWSTRNAHGGVIPRSTSRSVSITCC